MKKVRSMKLQRLSSRGRRKPQHDYKFPILSSVGTIEMADASPNYMKGTSSSSSHAKDSFQVLFSDSENLEFLYM
jgi:U3 small nucleolar ribonucleoprotein component